MQQTEKYKLNLIESSDPFLPEGLNQNTQKIEAAMIAHEAAVQAETVILEGKMLKFAYGAAEKGSADKITVHLPFKPKAVIIHGGPGTPLQNVLMAAVTGVTTMGGSFSLTMTEDGFQVGWGSSCHYIAFG